MRPLHREKRGNGVAKSSKQALATVSKRILVKRSPEQIAREKELRERLQRDKPSLEELVSSGEYNKPLPMGEFLSIRVAVSALRKAREAAGLSLSDLAKRTGI